VFGSKRHEALPIVTALNHLPLPRPGAIELMAETLSLLTATLAGVHLESYSLLPPRYHLCGCRLIWRLGEKVQEQTRDIRAGDAIGLALLLKTALSVSEELFAHMSVSLAEGQTPEVVFARHLLKQEGIVLPPGRKLRPGYSGTPLRDALVREFKACLLGKAPVFPAEDMQRRKQDYLAFLLAENAPVPASDQELADASRPQRGAMTGPSRGTCQSRAEAVPGVWRARDRSVLSLRADSGSPPPEPGAPLPGQVSAQTWRRAGR
jgi:bifunctional DNase/RNase